MIPSLDQLSMGARHVLPAGSEEDLAAHVHDLPVHGIYFVVDSFELATPLPVSSGRSRMTRHDIHGSTRHA